jgi:hypothetical protein
MSLIRLSQKQIDAARHNGAKSRGPKTPEGKARSSMNALKHGRHAKLACVLRGENKEAFQSLLHSLVRRFQPVDEAELSLIRILASIDWRLARIIAAESRILDMEIDVQVPALENAGGSPSELDRLAFSIQSLVDRSKLPQFLAGRESQLIFQRQSILQQLRQLRRDWPLSAPSPQIVEPEPLDPELPLGNDPGTNPQPVASTGSHPPPESTDIIESEVA